MEPLKPTQEHPIDWARIVVIGLIIAFLLAEFGSLEFGLPIQDIVGVILMIAITGTIYEGAKNVLGK